eukprot:m51a1_g2894 hypothetical protein (852) ;mRNA; f:435409-439420
MQATATPTAALALGLLLAAAATRAAAERCEDVSCGYQVEIPAGQCECAEASIGRTLTPCDQASRTRKLLAFWKPPATCLVGNVTLPDPIVIPCDLQCTPGQIIDKASSKCKSCEAGSYAPGPAVVVDTWNDWPSQMTTGCTTTAVPGPKCRPWRLLGRLVDSNNNTGVHKLSNWIITPLRFLRPGKVSFTYRVSSEPSWDGMAFRIDGIKALSVTGVANWTTFTAEVTEGYHVLQWEYFKDVNMQRNEDRAYIRNLTITGIAPPPSSCTPCPAGSSQGLAGQPSCTPCEANTYSPGTGATSCLACPAGKISPAGSTTCYNAKACTPNDWTYSLSKCANGKQTKTYSWIQPPSCDISKATSPLPASETVDCQTPVCKAGQYLKDGECVYCSEGTHSSAASQTACAQCGLGSQAAVAVAYITNWDPAAVPTGFSSSCTGQCNSRGWRSAYNFIDSGSYHAAGAVSTLQYSTYYGASGVANFTVQLHCVGTSANLTLQLDNEAPTTYRCTGCDAKPFSVSVALTSGRHSIRWAYHKNRNSFDDACDSARVISASVADVVGSGGATACAQCPAGTFGDQPSHCAPCAAGSWNNEQGARSCAPCRANTFSKAGSSQCTPCGAGTTSVAASASCAFNCSWVLPSGASAAYSLDWLPKKDVLLNGTFVLSACPTSAADNYVTIISDSVKSTEANAVAFNVYGPAPTDGLNATYSGASGCVARILYLCDPTDKAGTFASSSADQSCPSYTYRSQRACRVCTSGDYTAENGPCSNGKRTVTYHWTTDRCTGGVSLPEPSIADCPEPSPKWRVYALIGGGIAVVVVIAAVAIITSLFMYNRRIYRQYQQLLVNDSTSELSS